MVSSDLMCGGQPDDRSGGEENGGAEESRPRSRRPGAYHVPSLEEIYSRIERVAGMIALGLMAPKAGAVLLSCLREMLKYHQNRSSPAGSSRIPDESLFEMAKKTPEILSMIEPLLTEDQVALVMKRPEGDADG